MFVNASTATERPAPDGGTGKADAGSEKSMGPRHADVAAKGWSRWRRRAFARST
jgi:hypothetical protein